MQDFTKKLRREIKKEKKLLMMARLNAREIAILEFRFGLNDGITRTLEETGRLYNITRERVRQIEARSLEKLGLTTS